MDAGARLFDIFSPPIVRNPCTNTVRGTASPAAISSAGQITAWNRAMSLPITCRSAGQRAANSSGSVPNPMAVA